MYCLKSVHNTLNENTITHKAVIDKQMTVSSEQKGQLQRSEVREKKKAQMISFFFLFFIAYTMDIRMNSDIKSL